MHTRLLASVVVAATLAVVSAIPNEWLPERDIEARSCSGCSLKGAAPVLPPNQTNVTISGDIGALKYIALGYGVQNYTCTNGKYVSAGAVAKLYDISCLTKNKVFNSLPSLVVGAPDLTIKVLTRLLAGTPLFLGDHYFITNSAGAIAPKFDFTSGSRKNDPTAYVVAKKLGGTPAPNPADVDYLQLQGVEGNLAKYVYRVATKGGQPPSSCISGTKSVEYATQYWFYG